MFITFDGIEGGGKTTQIEALCAMLKQKNIAFIQTREPGGTAIGEQVRELLLGDNNMHSDTELLLMFAARAEHVQQVIKPALAQKKWVICDRFTDASFAYQGGGRGLDWQRIQVLADWVHQKLQPHRSFIFDIDVKVGLQRAKNRSQPDRFEQETLRFFQQTRDAYLKLVKDNPQRCRIIDATQTIDTIHQQIIADLEL